MRKRKYPTYKEWFFTKQFPAVPINQRERFFNLISEHAHKLYMDDYREDISMMKAVNTLKDAVRKAFKPITDFIERIFT